jgi:thioester reductase-like protein
MNHLETYEMAKPANVESAREILRLATCNKPKLVNYVSTLSVFSTDGSNRLRVVNEYSPIAMEQHLRSRGYEATKWVADGIFQTAARREIPCNVLRVGLVWADSQQGRYDELQREYRILKTSLLAGVAIENYQYEMPPTPVDYVARAVIFLSRRHSDGRHVFHISSPAQKIDGVFERCNEIAGVGLTLVRPHEWYEQIRNLHANGQSLPAAPLIECNDEARGDSQSGLTQIDCSRTLRELEAAGIVAPVVDDELLGLHLRFVLARDPELRGLGADTQAELVAAAGQHADGRPLCRAALNF